MIPPFHIIYEIHANAESGAFPSLRGMEEKAKVLVCESYGKGMTRGVIVIGPKNGIIFGIQGHIDGQPAQAAGGGDDCHDIEAAVTEAIENWYNIDGATDAL